MKERATADGRDSSISGRGADGPARLEAQHAHREVAISDTYTMNLRPTVDRIAESIKS